MKDETEHVRPIFNQVSQQRDTSVARSVLLATSTHAAKDHKHFPASTDKGAEAAYWLEDVLGKRLRRRQQRPQQWLNDLELACNFRPALRRIQPSLRA